MKCSVFQDFSRNIGEVELSEIASDIQSGKYLQQVQEIRVAQSQNNFELKNKLKEKLPAFTPSGIFGEKRQKSFLNRYNQIIHLDFDNISREDLNKSIEKIRSIPETFMYFLSPSGNGVKVFSRVDANAEEHEISYIQVQDYYESIIRIKADKSCKDITRLCFVSFDPDLYLNENSKIFNIDIGKVSNANEDRTNSLLVENLEILSRLWSISELKFKNEVGDRNNLVHYFACECNRHGIDKSYVIKFVIDNCTLSVPEIKLTVRGVYSRNLMEFGQNKPPQSLDLSNQLDVEDFEDILRKTPLLPDDVFSAIPEMISSGASVFKDKRRRDVFFTGALSILSGCMPNVSGVYFQDRVYPNIYTFIIAPPSSGKGVLKFAKKLADKYHQNVLKNSQEDKKKYEIELRTYNESLRQKNKNDVIADKPEEPKFRVVFIPANCSQSRMIDHLEKNDGNGIICETEADTMSNSKKQEWGDYSPILRAAFQHERIAYTRKTNNEYVEINEPRLSVSLSGTPGQVPKLISSAEDGLFSRFLFYAFKNELEWLDPSPNGNGIVFNNHFDGISQEILDMICFLESSPTEVKLLSNQWRLLNETFSELLAEVAIFTGDDAVGLVYRLGLITFRICMIFTTIRKFENGDAAIEVYCSDDDFYCAIDIAKTYLKHSIIIFNNLPHKTEETYFKTGDSMNKLFENLPDEFSRKIAIELGKKFKNSPRSVDSFLKNATGIFLEKIKNGHYKKI